MILQGEIVVLIYLVPQLVSAFPGDFFAGGIYKAEPGIQDAPPVMAVSFSQCNPGGIVLAAGNDHIVVYSCGKITPGDFQSRLVGIAALCQILTGGFFNRGLLFSEAADGFFFPLSVRQKLLNIVQNQTADLQLDLLVSRAVAVCQNMKTEKRRSDSLCQSLPLLLYLIHGQKKSQK